MFQFRRFADIMLAPPMRPRRGILRIATLSGVIVPGLTGQSGIPGLCLLDRPVEPMTAKAVPKWPAPLDGPVAGIDDAADEVVIVQLGRDVGVGAPESGRSCR